MLVIVGSAFADDEPLLSYHWSGGLSPYEEVRVLISPSGSASVSGKKQGLPPVDYHTELLPDEVAALRALIRSTDFFNQPDQDTSPATDVGETVLKVHAEGKSRILTYGHRPSLEPLNHFIWKLITQAFALQAIESDGDIYTATGAVTPTSAAPKALQPQALKAPFMWYVRNHNARQKVQWALEALASITTPEEFCGLVAMGIEEDNQKFLGIIGTHPFCDNIPDSHLKALCPIYLSFARNAHPHIAQLSSTEINTLYDFTRLIGKTRYEPAIPLLTQWFEEQDQPYVTASLCPLAEMGVKSLQVLTPYLDRPEEAYRINATELLAIASRLGPNGGFANPLSSYEFGRMIPVFTKTVIPRLRDLSENDPSPKVKKMAAEALEEIVKQIKKEGIPTSN
jgi:hypothetical protein